MDIFLSCKILKHNKIFRGCIINAFLYHFYIYSYQFIYRFYPLEGYPYLFLPYI